MFLGYYIEINLIGLGICEFRSFVDVYLLLVAVLVSFQCII